MSDRALNRALLARQGLLDRFDAPVIAAVESIGAIHAQHWPAVAVALWSRIASFEPSHLYAALDAGDVVVGSLIRRTLHLVTAREHPAYAAVTDLSGNNDWRRTKAEPSPDVAVLSRELRKYATGTPRSADEITEFIERWVSKHPGVIDDGEVDFQRKYKWRPFRSTSAFVRVPTDGAWGSRAPESYMASPAAGDEEAGDAAVREVVTRHLRAFGPAAAEDVAGWIGWRTPPVREALEQMHGTLCRFVDERRRVLYDLADAPRASADEPAPPRLLPWFDSILLAYASRRRARILPDVHRDAVILKTNLQVRPTFLVDGVVAGTWSIATKRKRATLTLEALDSLHRSSKSPLIEEAERLVRTLTPDVSGHEVVVAT